jgi:hypothetical protein
MGKFALPESLTDLDAAALDDLVNAGLDAYRELGLTEDSPEETVAEAEAIVAAVSTVRAELARRTDLAGRAAAAAAAVAAMSETPEEPPAQPEPAAEPVPDEPAAEPETAPQQAEAVAETPVPEPVAAAGHPASTARKNGPPPMLPKEKNVSVVLTASADVPGYALGAELADIDVVGQALIARMKSFPTGPSGDQRQTRYGAAVITKQRTDGFSQDNPDFRDDQALMDAVGREARLSGGSLIASGGWCAPSETMYDLCAPEVVDGLISLPEVGVTRGGIRFTTGPSFDAIYAGVGFTQTEAQAIAGTVKPCYDVPCPTFTEVRLDAVGVCIRAGILTNAAYPELVRRVTQGALVAHQYQVNAANIAKMLTLAGAALAPPTQGSTVSTLEALAWVAISLRQKYRLGINATLEVVLPSWGEQVLREDLAKRSGRDTAQVPAAELAAWFTDRHLAVQYVYGLNDLDVAVLDIAPPASMDALIYPAGTFVRGTSDVINLDAVYDSTGLSTNTYTALFAEEGNLIALRCNEASRVTIPICGSGRTGAPNLVKCQGTSEP